MIAVEGHEKWHYAAAIKPLTLEGVRRSPAAARTRARFARYKPLVITSS